MSDEAYSRFFSPRARLALAVVTTSVMFVWLGWHVMFTHKEFEALRASVIQAEKAHATILELHQQMVFFVRLASTTNWPWPREEYDKTREKLEALLAGNAAGNGAPAFQRPLSYDVLRAIERDAFALVDDGRHESAASMLFSDRYEGLTEQFREQTSERFRAIQSEIHGQFDSLEEWDYASLFFAVVIFMVSVLIWFYLYRNLVRWQRRLRKEVEHRESVEHELFQSQKMEAIGQMSAGISHDFNNLMAVIHGYSELVESRLGGDAETRRLVKSIKQAAAQANDVTRALLTLSSATPPRKEPVDLTTVLHETTELLRELLPASITLVREQQEAGDVWVMANRGQLQQAILNLALNARDAMPEGGEIMIATRTGKEGREELPGRLVHIDVIDSGSGIDEATLNRIREPYFTTKPRTRGTGLGLAVVDGIVKAHQGHLAVESRVGAGSRFTITLEAIDPPGAVHPGEAAPRETVLWGGRVLMVQGRDYTRSVLTTALTRAGYATAVVDPEDEGDESDLERRFDLLILDVDSAGEKGLKLLRRLRDNGDERPAILLCGAGEDARMDDIDEWTLILEKPVQLASLTALVDRLLGRRPGRDAA